MYETLETSRHEGLLQVTLNRPELHNAFNSVLVRELTAVLDSAGRDEGVKALLLAGAGKSFCAGADTGWMRGMAAASEAENREDALQLARMLRRLNFLPCPTLARVHGAAYGGGIGLVACCDIAIGAEGASFALSEVKLGLVPATIAPYVIAAIGARQARRLFVTGEVFDAPRAAAIGLLHECVPADALDASIERVLKAMHRGGPEARREAKQLALRVGGMDEEQAAREDALNAHLIARVRVGAEGQEGLSAFLDKRKPAWAEKGTPR